MQNLVFFKVKPSQIDNKLGNNWTFLKKKSIEVPDDVSYHNDRLGFLGIGITLLIAFLLLPIGGILLYGQFNSSVKLDYWFLAVSLLAILWSSWKFWQMQFYLFGKVPRKRLGFWLDEQYLVHAKNKQTLMVFSKESISRIEFLYKKTPNAQAGYNENCKLKIYPRLEEKPYRHKLNMVNVAAFIQILEKANINVDVRRKF